MKIPKEYLFIFIIGLFLISYVLEATVNPLSVKLATPYEFLSKTYLSQFPFSTAVIIIRSLGIFLIPILLFSFFNGAHFPKSGILLIVSALLQLYAMQEVVSGTTLLPLEWSLSLSIGGLALLVPMIFHLLAGTFFSTVKKVSPKPQESTDKTDFKI